MRRPEKSSKLYTELREAIFSRRFCPGTQLPRETELAEDYGVSRDTLRAALARLEKEALVKRVRGQGTFVGSGRETPKITFMLPCSNSFQLASPSLIHVFQGVLTASHDFDCQVEALPLSPNNDPENIDWTKLLSVSGESKVIVMGFWFSGIFDFLKNAGCRVVFIHDGTYQQHEHRETLERWVVLEKKNFEAARRLTLRLIERGCRKPALLSPYVREHLQPRVLGFQAALEEAGLVPSAGNLIHIPHDATFTAIYEEARRKFRFDGVLTENDELLEYIAISGHDLLCGGIGYSGRMALPGGISLAEFPLNRIGYDAVRALLEPEFVPLQRQYHAEIREQRDQAVENKEAKHEEVLVYTQLG